MNENQLKERIEKLEAENRALKKLKAPVNRNKLPFVNNYDTSMMVSVDDVVQCCIEPEHLENLTKGDVRSIVRLFGLKAVAQYKTEGSAGRGTLLYSLDKFNNILGMLG